MERTVPSTASEEIELFLRTVYSLLRSTTEVQIRTLEEVHAGMNSSLHLKARSSSPDTSAFIYTQFRLPPCISEVQLVVLGQSGEVFRRHDYPDVESWPQVSARARRRRCFFNGEDTLACFIASRTDIDDVIPTLTAYQIEWNKLHVLLQNCPQDVTQAAIEGDARAFARLADALDMPADDLERLRTMWGDQFGTMLEKIGARRRNMRIRLLSGSLSEYWRATRAWWDNIEHACPALLDRPVYFISSNPHSLPNLLSGYTRLHQSDLVNYVKNDADPELNAEWQDISFSQSEASRENFFYYALKKYEESKNGNKLAAHRQEHERSLGIMRIPAEHYFDVEAQVIEIGRLDPKAMDPRLPQDKLTCLKESDALILNIDYPLGLGAYNILAKVAEHASQVVGVYVMGKSASLNAVIGDVMIPNVVYDEHSHNTYLFRNAFTAASVSPFLTYGTVLDNQKAVSVLGTFLQNARLMDVVYREGYTDIEMEAGPYLSAMYEMYRPIRHPVNEIVNLYSVPFDIGILHYVSDTPLSKGRNLGAGALSYRGMDSTYASTLAIINRILELECERIASG
jgi:hypothetical protein